jgi:hypothetical protein
MEPVPSVFGGKSNGKYKPEAKAEIVVKLVPSTFAGHSVLCPYDGNDKMPRQSARLKRRPLRKQNRLAMATRAAS